MSNINDLQEQFENIIKQGQELIEKLKKEKSNPKRWKPKDGETYWHLFGDGTIEYNLWVSKDDISLNRYKLGNCFKTKEEAQKELDRRLAEKELLDLCDWEDEEQHHLMYSYNEDCFESECRLFFGHSPYRFASEESAKKAIDTLGTKKLKLIFRIED